MKTPHQWADEWFARDWSTPSNAKAHIEDDIAAVQADALENAPPRLHAGDCTIYASLVNGTPLDGICTCGYGWERIRHDDWTCMFSQEWLKAHNSFDCRTSEAASSTNPGTLDQLPPGAAFK